MVGRGVPGGDLVLPGEAAGEETGDGAQLSWRRCPNHSLQRHQEQRRQYSRSSSRQGSVTRIIENIPDDNIAHGVSLHSPRRDTDQFGNAYEPLVIKGNINTSYPQH